MISGMRLIWLFPGIEVAKHNDSILYLLWKRYNRMPEKHSFKKWNDAPYTVGFITEKIVGGFNAPLWRGVEVGAEELNINLITFSINESTIKQEKQSGENDIYQLISPHHIEGLIISYGMLCIMESKNQLTELIQRNTSLPVITIAVRVEGEHFPCISADNYNGMFDVVNHLINEHGRQRIGFIRGPQNHPEEEERYRAYEDALISNGIQVDESLISPHCNWSTMSVSKKAVSSHIEHNRAAMDALIGANDILALIAMEELKQYGIRIPDDIAVAGFDNIDASYISSPPLTTVQNATFEMGKKAVESLVALLKGEIVSETLTIPSRLIIRQSCCSFHRDESLRSFESDDLELMMSEKKLSGKKEYFELIIDEFSKRVFQLIPDINIDQYIAGIESLLVTFTSAITEGKEESFLCHLEALIKKETVEGNMKIYQDLLHLLHNYLKVHCPISDFFKLSQDLLLAARYCIENRIMYEYHYEKQYMSALSNDMSIIKFEMGLISTYSDLINNIDRQVRTAGIKRAYLFLYNEVGVASSECRLVYYINEKSKESIMKKKNGIPSDSIISQDILQCHDRFSLVVQPLKSTDDAFGFIVFEVSSQEGSIYFDICAHLNNSLRGLLSVYKLKKIMNGMINALIRAVESRDPCAAGHLKNVAELSTAIALEMGFSEDTVEGIYMTASIHDIGRISVPAEILCKPSKLTDIEYNIVKTHAKVGFEILEEISFPWPIAEIIYQHHERLDGSGYPRGLCGDEIMREARILAVADVMEAMCSYRPYRPAFSVDQALDEIINNRAVLYDPDVVDVCVRLFREEGFQF
jgi:putative nucleotidyltransferase with HDIG domain